MSALTPPIRRWIESAAGPGARIVGARPWPPSSTAKLGVELETLSGALRLVLRRYHDATRADDPWYQPANEAAALRLLEPTPVPAPRLLAADLTGDVCGVPALLQTWVPGVVEWVPSDPDAYLASAAEVLVAIHAVRVAPGDVADYERYIAPDGLRVQPWCRPGLWEGVLEVVAGPPPAVSPCFIHRDYHQGNVLSEGGRVVAVVDWPTAAIAPPGIDLARMRMNLAWEANVALSDRFLRAYEAAGGSPEDRHPYWDLVDAADMLEDDGMFEDQGQWDRFEDWVAHVLAEL